MGFGFLSRRFVFLSLSIPPFIFVSHNPWIQPERCVGSQSPMTLGSYSILEAALALERRRGGQQESSSKPKTQSPTLGPVDVVAVVSGIATLQSPPASSATATPRVDLRIADQSIPNYMTAKVSLYGSQEAARISEEQIAPGDIVRFNRIGLSRRHRPQAIEQIARNTEGFTVRSKSGPPDENTIHFEHSADDPEPGWRWYKLGRIRTTVYGDDQHDHQERISIAGRKAFLCEDERQSRNFPDEMATAETRIQELIAWFVSRGQDDGANNSLGAEGANNRTARSLSPLPCKRRSLAEIQASSGLLSNIHVQVTHCDSQVLPPCSSTSSPAAKKQRSGAVKSLPQQQQVIGFATVTDNSGVVLSLVDPGSRFGSVFQAAQNQGKILMMSNILSKKQSDIYGRPLVSEEVVLWPTRKTAASILSSSSSDGDEKVPMTGAQQGKIPSRTSKEDQCVKSPNTNKMIRSRSHGGKMEEANSETQLTQRHPTFHNETSTNYVLVESRLVDILVNETSLRQCINRTPHSLKEHVLSADDKDYLPAVLHLEPIEGLFGVEKGKKMDRFLAGTSVIHALCGGVTPSEWNINNGSDDGGGATTKSSTAVGGGNVLRLLHALFDEGIALQWTIDVGHDPPRVIKVSLPRV